MTAIRHVSILLHALRSANARRVPCQTAAALLRDNQKRTEPAAPAQGRTTIDISALSRLAFAALRSTH
jgi:hypothetical protein